MKEIEIVGCNLDEIDNDCYDAYKGQIECQIIAYNKEGFAIGQLGYSIFNNEIHINTLGVKIECRRQGIASKMMQKLEEQQLSINTGFTTEEGEKFFKRYNEQKRGK